MVVVISVFRMLKIGDYMYAFSKCQQHQHKVEKVFSEAGKVL